MISVVLVVICLIIVVCNCFVVPPAWSYTIDDPGSPIKWSNPEQSDEVESPWISCSIPFGYGKENQEGLKFATELQSPANHVWLRQSFSVDDMDLLSSTDDNIIVGNLAVGTTSKLAIHLNGRHVWENWQADPTFHRWNHQIELPNTFLKIGSDSENWLGIHLWNEPNEADDVLVFDAQLELQLRPRTAAPAPTLGSDVLLGLPVPLFWVAAGGICAFLLLSVFMVSLCWYSQRSRTTNNDHEMVWANPSSSRRPSVSTGRRRGSGGSGGSRRPSQGALSQDMELTGPVVYERRRSSSSSSSSKKKGEGATAAPTTRGSSIRRALAPHHDRRVHFAVVDPGSSLSLPTSRRPSANIAAARRRKSGGDQPGLVVGPPPTVPSLSDYSPVLPGPEPLDETSAQFITRNGDAANDIYSTWNLGPGFAALPKPTPQSLSLPQTDSDPSVIYTNTNYGSIYGDVPSDESGAKRRRSSPGGDHQGRL